MKLRIRQATPWVTVCLTVLLTVLRVATAGAVNQEAVGEFGVSFWLLLILVLSAVVLSLPAWLMKETYRPSDNLTGDPVGWAAVAAGAALMLETILSLFQVVLTGETPPPNAQILNDADRATLWLSLVFGLLAGGFLMLRGVRMARGIPVTSAERFAGLFPVLWIWFRLARYEISYASAMSVKQSFYDFFMLVFLMLFLLAFSRFCAGVTVPTVRSLRVYAAVAAAVGLSSPLARLGMHFLQDSSAYNASPLAGVSDLAIGALALVVTFFLYRRVTPPRAEEPPIETGSPTQAVEPAEPAEPITPTADLLIDEWLSAKSPKDRP